MEDRATHVTKVLFTHQVPRVVIICVAILTSLLPQAVGQPPPEKPVEALYLQLGQVALDPTRVYQVRGAAINRSSVQISLDDGTIAFTEDVMGKVTGAFFEGDGEILLAPPNEVERRSMTLFTGMAILEERFSSAYFRFNDDLPAELQADLRATDNKQEFVDRWNPTAKNLAFLDAMRLLMTFSRNLPVEDAENSQEKNARAEAANLPDRFLHARLNGNRFGVFEVYFDSIAREQIQTGQAKSGENGAMFYDVWTSFPSAQEVASPSSASTRLRTSADPGHPPRVTVDRYTISAEILPPKTVRARAKLECEAPGDGRILLFELSRFLQVESVSLNGKPVEFIHNPALEGTALSRRGNDVVAVALPAPVPLGQKFNLDFTYSGDVLADAGSGLMYVGARGTWYPNRGMEMSNFDLEFTYPPGWTLLATGRPEAVAPDHVAKAGTEQISRWVSERPIPLAGFNLGKYREAATKAGDVTVAVYATQGVEKDFPTPPIRVLDPDPVERSVRRPELIVPSRPSPVKAELTVEETAAHAIDFFAKNFGGFPYSKLALTQMPGRESQGWPGLVFLSSYAFLNQQQREELHYPPSQILLQKMIPAHETAHQWWGDLITWDSYRDQWFSEGLANYSSLMMLQESNPTGFRLIMDKYRQDLVEKNKDGMSPSDAGPVTLGPRLLSSKFPEGYEAISYGRGTWLFYMLRTMLDDAEERSNHKGQDEPFVRALRRLRQRYQGQSINTKELLDGFAEDLPASLRYEGKNSLEWFLNSWVNGTSLPMLELKSAKFSAKGSNVMVSGTILQKNSPEDLVTSVPVYAVISGKPLQLLGRVFADGRESSFRLTAPAGTRKIQLDPYQTVLTSPK